MPTELEELVEFLHHGNTQIRQVAIENLVGFSTSQPEIFKTGQLTPVKDLKLLVRDYTPIAKNALEILINLSDDSEVLEYLAKDDAFLELLLSKIQNPKEPNANLVAMLLANLAKSDSLSRLFTLTRTPVKGLSVSKNAMDQLMDCFVKGAEGRYNKDADFDYLAYFFADMAKHPEGRQHFTSPSTSAEDSLPPITKLQVFTSHPSVIRRRGVASALKNTAFHVEAHPALLAPYSTFIPPTPEPINLLPYLLTPLMGSEDYPDEEMLALPDEVQLQEPDKEREPAADIVATHLETLLLLTSTREGRDVLREKGVYAVVREVHLHVEDEAVRDGADRVVQVIMRREEGEEESPEEKEAREKALAGGRVEEIEEDEEERIEEVF